MKQVTISEAVIRRLPRYYRCLADMEKQGVQRTSSQEISRILHLTASQIRQDFNCFGGFGQQGYGYHVATLKGHISRILGLEHSFSMVVIGAGNLGRALVAYKGFESEGFHIAGVFDMNPALIGQSVGNYIIQSSDLLEEFLQNTFVDIGVIAVGKEAAQEVADRLIRAGVKGIWNFAPTDVLPPTDTISADMSVSAESAVKVENVHLNDSLYVLAYRLFSGN